jgi:transcriptional regulator with XRE-family HTH domain
MHRSSEADPALAAAIRKVREARGESREKCANRAGLTGATWMRIESGRSSPAWATVRRMAEALDLSMPDLAELVENERRGDG